MKKYIAEAIGTAVLVTVGCGTAMLVGCDVTTTEMIREKRIFTRKKAA